jgi:hypothetical protein
MASKETAKISSNATKILPNGKKILLDATTHRMVRSKNPVGRDVTKKAIFHFKKWLFLFDKMAYDE